MRVYTLLILFVLGGLSMGYGQQLPADFPKYVDTGDKERDALSFYQAKKAWILQNDAAYKEMPETLKKSLFFDNSPYLKETFAVENHTPKCENCEQPVLLSSKEIVDKKNKAGSAIQVVEVVKDENWKSPEEWEAIKMREIENTESNRSITRKEFNRLKPNEQIEVLTRQVKIKDLGTLFQNSVRWDNEPSKRYIQEEDFYSLSIEDQQAVLTQKDKFEVISTKYYVLQSDLEGATEDKRKSVLSDKSIVIIED